MTRVSPCRWGGHRLLPGLKKKNGPLDGRAGRQPGRANKIRDDGGDWGRAATRDLIRSRIKVKSLNFMRGCTFFEQIPHHRRSSEPDPQTNENPDHRAGLAQSGVPGAISLQIDTPTSPKAARPLPPTWWVKNWAHAGHITLQRGERSRLADFAAEVL